MPRSCQRCRTIRSSAVYTRLAARVVAEEPICWLRLPGCTAKSTTADHIIGLHADHTRALDRDNLRGACRSCNTRRANRSIRDTAALAHTPKPRRPRPTRNVPKAPKLANQPALMFFHPIPPPPLRTPSPRARAAPPVTKKRRTRKHDPPTGIEADPKWRAITLAQRW